MERRIILPILIAAIILCLCALPAAAVTREITLKGPLSTLSQQKNTLTIENPQQYGCDYPASGSPVCSYTPMNTSAVTGTAPNDAAFSVFKTGDQIVATGTDSTGGEWITLAKLYGSRPNEEYVTDIVGDPGTIPAPLIGNYTLDVTMNPDCSACTGTTCTARSSDVTVKTGTVINVEQTLLPGQVLTYNGRNDGSSIAVTFVKGEALSETCAGMKGMTGPQAVPVFVIRVVPPTGFTQKDIRTATTTRPDEALTPHPGITTGTIPATTLPAPTAKSGSLPFAVIGALGVITLVFAAQKR
jgi:hypothetical protein